MLSRGVVCVKASAVELEAVWVLESTSVVEGWGTVSVDVPASLSGRSGSSQGAVLVTALAVVVVVCVLESTRLAMSASLSISVSVIPTSQPSLNPSSYPSSRAVVISCCTSLWL